MEGDLIMLYADSYYKYRAENRKRIETLLLPNLNWFNKLVWKLRGYDIYRLPSDPDSEN